MNVLVLIPYLYDTAPGQRFRIEQWARGLEERGVRFQFIPFETSALKEILHRRGCHLRKIIELLRGIYRRSRVLAAIDQRWDVILLYREMLPLGPPIFERLLAKKGIPIVYDFDDAIFLPEVSEANQRFLWLKWPQKIGTICRLSAYAIVGNGYLKDYALQFTPRVSVIPTTIDTDTYTLKPSAEIRETPVIGWSGSMTTLKHLRVIEPTLRALRCTTPYRLKVVGQRGVEMDGLDVESKDWDRKTEVADLQSFDIGMMPLPDDAWARGKCGLKLLQYMAVGVPTVASPVGVNVEIIQDGINGFLASTEQEWVAKLQLLISDRALRERLAKAGRETIEQKYAAKLHAPHLLEVLRAVQHRPAAEALTGESNDQPDGVTAAEYRVA